METTTARFYCTIMKMEISILYHVIVNSQLSRDNLTRRYIIYDMIVCVPRLATDCGAVSFQWQLEFFKFSAKNKITKKLQVPNYSNKNHHNINILQLPFTSFNKPRLQEI